MDLAKKDAFCWNASAQEAFAKLKRRITTVLVLAFPNFSQQIEMECDASSVGVGAIWMQKKRLIAFFNKALEIRNSAKSMNVMELMALALSIQH